MVRVLLLPLLFVSTWGSSPIGTRTPTSWLVVSTTLTSIGASSIPSAQSQVKIEGAASEEVSPPTSSSTTTNPPASHKDPIAASDEGNMKTASEPGTALPVGGMDATGATTDRDQATGATSNHKDAIGTDDKVTAANRDEVTGGSVTDGRSRRSVAGDSSLYENSTSDASTGPMSGEDVSEALARVEKSFGSFSGYKITPPKGMPERSSYEEKATGAVGDKAREAAASGDDATRATTTRDEATTAIEKTTTAPTSCNVTIPKCSDLNVLKWMANGVGSVFGKQFYECTSAPDGPKPTFNITGNMSVPCPKCFLRHDLGYCYRVGMDEEADRKANKTNGTHANERETVMIRLGMTAEAQNSTFDHANAAKTSETNVTEELSATEPVDTTTDAATEETTATTRIRIRVTPPTLEKHDGMFVFLTPYEYQMKMHEAYPTLFPRPCKVRRLFFTVEWDCGDDSDKKSSRRATADVAEAAEVTGEEPKTVSDADGATKCQNSSSSDASWWDRIWSRVRGETSGDKKCPPPPPPPPKNETCQEGQIRSEYGFCDEKGNLEYLKALDLWFDQWNGWHAAKRLEKLKLEGKAPKDLEITPPENYTAVTEDETAADIPGDDGIEPIDIRERPCLKGQVRHDLGFCDFPEQIELFEELDRMNLKPKDWSATKKLKYLQSSGLIPRDAIETKKKTKREAVMTGGDQTTGATPGRIDATATKQDEATADGKATGVTLDSATATADNGDKTTGATATGREATGPNDDEATRSSFSGEGSISDDTESKPCPPGRHRHVKGSCQEVPSPEGSGISAKEIRSPGDL